MTDLIGDSVTAEGKNKEAKELRNKYRQAIEDRKYQNLHKVPPHLQKHSKRFIDGKSKGLGTSHNSNSITTKFPPEMDGVLRDMKNKSDYIRRAVLERLHKDGLATDYQLPELDE